MTEIAPCHEEEWRVIAEFPDYSVSNQGRVRRDVVARNNRKPGLLRPQRMPRGYRYVTLTDGITPHNRTVHRLVALAFLGEPPADKPEVNHIDFDKTHNDVRNLEWCSRLRNARHAREAGRYFAPQGELCGNAKLEESDIPAIFIFNRSGWSHAAIARRLNVSARAICDVLCGRTWRHVS